MQRQKMWLVVGIIVLISVMVLPQVSNAQNGSQVHIVRAGETLTSIASTYHVTVDALMAVNHLGNANVLYVGERLVIPPDPPGQAAQPLQSAPGTYTVQPGDTLSSIDARFGVSIAQLAAANKITDPSLVVVGRVLKIPVVSFGSAASAASPPLSDGQQAVVPPAPGPAVSFQIVNGQLVSLTLQTVSTGHQSLPLSFDAKIAPQHPVTYGLNFDEISFQNHLPHSLNPKQGFVGSVYGRFYWPGDVLGGTASGPGGYSVHVEGWRPTFQALSGFPVCLLGSHPTTASAQIGDAVGDGS